MKEWAPESGKNTRPENEWKKDVMYCGEKFPCVECPKTLWCPNPYPIIEGGDEDGTGSKKTGSRSRNK